jgi:hypothetical protein
MLKCETLDVKESSVALATSIVYFSPEQYSQFECEDYIKELQRTALFVKFNIKDQHQNYNRTLSKSTMNYWKDLPTDLKNKVFFPNSSDMLLVNGIKEIQNYIKTNIRGKDVFWARGFFTPMVYNSLCRSVGEYAIGYNNWRDIRTALDMTKENVTERGICPIIGKDMNFDVQDPTEQCINDIIMLMYGK